MRRASFLAMGAACLLGVACGAGADEATTTSSSTSNATACGAAIVNGDPSTPVSFRTDVMPIFTKSCAFSSCHGGTSAASNHGVHLGADASALHAAIVGVASTQAPSLSYVEPGAPSRSYLMHKLDGDLCTIAESCTNGDCLGAMPKGSDALPAAKRDVVRRWIANGARDD